MEHRPALPAGCQPATQGQAHCNCRPNVLLERQPGRVARQRHPNRATTYFSYDAAGRLSEKLTVKEADSSVLVRFAYTRDAAGSVPGASAPGRQSRRVASKGDPRLASFVEASTPISGANPDPHSSPLDTKPVNGYETANGT